MELVSALYLVLFGISDDDARFCFFVFTVPNRIMSYALLPTTSVFPLVSFTIKSATIISTTSIMMLLVKYRKQISLNTRRNRCY